MIENFETLFDNDEESKLEETDSDLDYNDDD